ncbi:MAG TPA: B12-binding domain-containing radical SAM protein [Desulfobacteraceae bacterium]|nr:B12-binding domain-containing radical SAM protein [Desulfobacteraceae bacterium]
MKVLLVNPACLDQRVTDQDALVVPIGLYYLSAQLMAGGISAPILNLAGMSAPENGSADPVALFNETLKEQQPDIIGFSVTNPSRINAMACAAAARKRLPEVLIMFGGPAPTFMADHLFRACPALDLVVKGEGEISVSKLTAAVQTARANNDGSRLPENLDQVKGLIIRRPTGLTDTGDAPPVENLDTLVHPSRYFKYQHLAMSRGCPGKCTFCGSPKFWGSSRVRRHSPDWFFEEIRALAAAGVTHFYISDDTFTMDRQAVLEFCDRIIAAGLVITWNAISRVDYIDAGLLSAMRRAGCIQISFGVESGSKLIKKRLGKPIDNEKSIEAFRLARAYGILPRAYFIYGSPGETCATIDESIRLLTKLAPLSTVFYMLVVFPGTHLYTRAVQKGLVTDDVWNQAIEDIPWFQLDQNLDFNKVKAFGDRLRQAFFDGLPGFVSTLELVDEKVLYPFHADFLSRLALTFSHGEYAQDPRVKDPEKIAAGLFKKALAFGHDPRAYLGLAMIDQKQRRFPDAVTTLKAGLAQFPDHKDLNTCMGVCLMNLGEFSKALDHFVPFDKDPGLHHYINICRQQTNA